MPQPEVSQLIPTFHVRDVTTAANWYRDVMGWDIAFIEAPGYAGVEIGGQRLHLAQWQRDEELQLSQAYVLLTRDVDLYYKELKARGATFHNEPTDHDYGLRECNLRDLDGNYLHLGQRIPQE